MKKLAEIPKNFPKIGHDEAREALAKAYRNLYHREPSEGELDFGLATAFFESGYGRAGAANWVKPGQFAKWALEGKFNWGALQSSIPGPERTFERFKSAGLHPIKEKGSDAGRPVYFYLFPNDVEAAQAFLMTWGRPDTLKAAASGSPEAVAKSMKDHNYYEGFWVPPGNPRNLKIPPFKEASSAEEAERNNIRDYARALAGQRAVVSGKNANRREPTQMAKHKPTNSVNLEYFLTKITDFFSSLIPSVTLAQDQNKFLITVGAEDFTTKTEYARILQSVLLEELKIASSIHYKDDLLEISCVLPFEKDQGEQILSEVCSAVSDTFEFATKKIGGCKTSTIILPETSSTYPEMDIKISEINRRKFKFKIAQGINGR